MHRSKTGFKAHLRKLVDMSAIFTFVAMFLAVFLASVSSAHGQTTRYNSRGDLLVMGGLIEDPTGCEPARSFSGTILKIATTADNDKIVGYEIILKPNRGRQQTFQASVTKDAGAALVDFEALMIRNRRVGIKARACGSGGFLIVEEVRRL
jgi:hypothetical protein